MTDVSRLGHAWLGMGTNLGDRAGNLALALGHISAQAQIDRVSGYYETEPVGYLDQPAFLNMACAVTTGLAPGDLLNLLEGDRARDGADPHGARRPTADRS